MKHLLAIFLTGFLTVSVASACEHDKAPAKAEASKEAAKEAPKAAEDFKEGEVKKVCVVINGKEKCKNMKMHHKFEGTKVPAKK